MQVRHGYDDCATNTFYYQRPLESYGQQDFFNQVGYLPDGTPLNTAGNLTNHPDTIGPDQHVAGSELPQAVFVSSIGHGSVTSPQTQRGHTAFVHTKLSRV